ncbi:MAG TPA: SpoIID/LytB domain-containing protein [Acidimicrobiales bacterium]|nr:SpoIID/LytB domain-containing protein [Acidimicrobiales bacterium]
MSHASLRAARPHHRRPHRRSRSLTAALAAAVLLLLAGASAVAAAPPAGVPVLRLDGKGHGHGVGLSQWGAHAMARAGADAQAILAHYYPGTSVGSGGGEVVVVVSETGRTLLSLPQGGELRSARDGAQAAGFPIPLSPGEVVAVHHDGSGYRVERAGVQPLGAGQAQPFQADDCVVLCAPEPEPEPQPDPSPEPEPAPEPSPDDCVFCPPPPGDAPDEPPPGQPPAAPQQPGEPAPPASGDAPRSPTPIWAVPAGGGTVHSVDRGRTYRGLLEVTGGPGALRVRNHVDVEDYLRGMAEVPGTWPAAAVQAQTVAARTYALRAMAGAGELCDSESCQVYAGIARESAGQDAAVAATRGWVVTHGGGLAATFYSASAGGYSATVQEGFGSDYDIPYLQARPEPGADPRAWQLEVSLADVAARLGYPGALREVRIDAAGPSGRPLAMTLVGDAGDRPVDPQVFRRRLGLRSTFFTVQTGTAGVAPPPPPAPVEEDQLLSSVDTPANTTTTMARRDAALAVPRLLPPDGPLPAAQVGRAAVSALAVALLAGFGVARGRRLGRLAPLRLAVPQRLRPGTWIRWRAAPAAMMARWKRRSRSRTPASSSEG